MISSSNLIILYVHLANSVVQATSMATPERIYVNEENSSVALPLLLNLITSQDVSLALDESYAMIAKREQYVQTQVYSKDIKLPTNSSAWFMATAHQRNLFSRNVERIALISESASRILAVRFNLSKYQIAHLLPILNVQSFKMYEECQFKPNLPCLAKKYRSYNGHCNNVQHPRWGSANSRYLRFIMPNYADGIISPRVGEDGFDLPSPRTVSLEIHKNSDRPHRHLLSLSVAWAEFIAEDILHTPQAAHFNEEPIRCCNIPSSRRHPECFPINIPENDPYFGPEQDCQEYVRSSSSPRLGCTLGPREQTNEASSFIDASMIYGSKDDSNAIRTFVGGFVIASAGIKDKIISSSTSVVLRAIWFREHNEISKRLAEINPHWSDETLFQETRAIVIAKIQHITYNEFLPLILGESSMMKYGLRLAPGFHSNYDINTNSGIFNEVSTAVLWYFISLMPKSISNYDEVSNSSSELHGDQVEHLLEVLIREKAQDQDQFINDLMTNKMFNDPEKGHGLDFVSHLIQQGRDHGLQGFVSYREYCGYSRPTSFDELNGIMPNEVVRSLKKLYRDVRDIDLLVGGLCENSVEGAVIGETFSCLLGTQFQNLRKGDRFWYENDMLPSSFTKDQIQEIRKTTLARVICDNTNSIKSIQPNPFVESDMFLNARMNCDENILHDLSLEKWRTNEHLTTLSQGKVRQAIRKAKADIAQLHSLERKLWEQSEDLDPRSPAGTAFAFSKPGAEALTIANRSILLEFATTHLISNITSRQSIEQQDSDEMLMPMGAKILFEALKSYDLPLIPDELPKSQICGEHDLPCDYTSRFRSVTGWCNNLHEPQFGKTFRAFNRFLPPQYFDGIQRPRSKTAKGHELPSPRFVSTTVHNDISIPHQRYSLLVMQYAQLLDHDLTHTPMNQGYNKSILDCHSCDSKETVHPECWPITIPGGDPHFPSLNATTDLPLCLAFTRSLPGQLTLGYREQLNQVTAYIDASHTYGSNTCESKKLRKFVGGQLAVTEHPGGTNHKVLLPQTSTHPECKAPSGFCFEAGDLRASEQPGLTAIHTIWLREHNRLASQLRTLNPQWDDEQLYQHSRRILSAITQHITYAEWLPRILGNELLHKYNLELLPEGYFTSYDPTCDATIFNEFATAAFRFGHSLLKPGFKRVSPSTFETKEPSIQLRHTFFNPDILFQPGIIDELIFGLVNTPMESLDNFVSKEVTNHLFESRKKLFSGMDLVALNLQRGRDHGIPSYNAYREFCNMSLAQDFRDFEKEIPKKTVASLESAYESVDDVDLFTGGLAETSVYGGLVGPTFACLIAKQFQLLRKCDRFWYENSDPFLRFTPNQLMELRKSSMSRLICDNGDAIQMIQKSSFDNPESFLNPRVPCNSLPRLNLDHWKDEQNCEVDGKEINMGSSLRITPCVMCTCTKEGPVCQSMYIENCFHLISLYQRKDILEDNVCKVQCAYVLRLHSDLK